MSASATVSEPVTQGVEPYMYAPGCEPRILPAALVFPELGEASAPAPQPSQHVESSEGKALLDRRLAEQAAQSYAEGHTRGFEEGRLAERESSLALEANEAQTRSAELARLVEQFTAERDRYLAAIEPEVVRLAVAIAARILRREAQTDPLLLLGAVRVALGQLTGATRLRLRVPAAHVALWTEAVSLLPSRSLRPEIVSDDALRLGECHLESEFGSVDLGVPAQLAEIERRLFTASAESPVAQESAS